MGSKTEHLTLAAKGKYPADQVLMVGDAPGDLKAARDVGALFFPINPGAEEESWERFVGEGIDRFFAQDLRRRLREEADRGVHAAVAAGPALEEVRSIEGET